MFGKKQLPKQWLMPDGDIYKVYLDMLEQPNIYFLGHQTVDRDLVRDGFMYTALSQPPSIMTFYLLDLCGLYMNIYRQLPHTIAYTNSEEEGLSILEDVQLKTIERLDMLRGNREKFLPTVWVVIDGYEALHFPYRKKVEKILSSILYRSRAANVHLALFTPYIKSSGGIDELFSSFGLFNSTDITNAKFRRIAGNKATNAPKEFIYKNIQGFCESVSIPEIKDDEIRNRVQWWVNQCGKKGRK